MYTVPFIRDGVAAAVFFAVHSTCRPKNGHLACCTLVHYIIIINNNNNNNYLYNSI